MKDLKIIGFCLFFVALWYLVMCLFLGQGYRTTEKTVFKEVDGYSYYRICFEKVLIKNTFLGQRQKDVWVEPAKPGMNLISVKIDPKIDYTALTVVPKFLSRIMSGYVCKAKKVIIWVPCEEDKLLWESWVARHEEMYFSKKKIEEELPSKRRIIPL